MGIATTLTIGADTYNVYGLTSSPHADAKTYFKGRFGSVAWDAAEVSDQKRALVSATRWLDRQPWNSVPTDVVTPQPLENPRLALKDCNGTVVLSTVVHDDIVEAMFELAQVILADSTEQESAGQGTNIRRVKAEDAEVEFFRNDVGTGRDTALPPIAHELIRCFTGGTGLGIPHVSGSGTGSVFDDTNSSNFDRGLS